MNYEDIITLENLFQAWNEFRKGKTQKKDVQLFGFQIEDNIYSLFVDLKNKTYRHGKYESFFVNDPKRRHIHKAPVRDRVVHHLLYSYLYEMYDKTFIFDSYSCRLNKGTHKGVRRLEKVIRIESKNFSRPCFTLQCDIQKFFSNVDHQILLKILAERIHDKDILSLLSKVIESFATDSNHSKGIPLGNLTSQVFANIYMNKLDQFTKHTLKIKHHLRYADDFIIVLNDKVLLVQLLGKIEKFLEEELKLSLHPKKIILSSIYLGIDFLGYILLPYCILPRTKTKRRLVNRIRKRIQEYKDEQISYNTLYQSIQSYMGYLGHGDTYKLQEKLKNDIWFWMNQ